MEEVTTQVGKKEFINIHKGVDKAARTVKLPEKGLSTEPRERERAMVGLEFGLGNRTLCAY